MLRTPLTAALRFTRVVLITLFSYADFDTVEQMVMGLQLDLAEDFEAIMEALESAREAFVFILE